MNLSIQMPQHLQPSSQEDLEFALDRDPLKKTKKASKKKGGKKSKSKSSSSSKKGKTLDISNHEMGDDFKNLHLVKKLNFLGGGGPLGGSSDDSVSERTAQTVPMDESFSSDADSLSPKSVETKDTKKKGKKKKEKKSKAEGKTKDKKEKKGKKAKAEKNADNESKDKKPKKPKRSKSMVVDDADKKEKKKEKKPKSEKNPEEKKGKKKKEKKLKSEKKLGEKKSKKKEKKPKSEKKPKPEILDGGKKPKKKDKKSKSSKDLGELVSKSFKIGVSSVTEDEQQPPLSEHTLLLDDISNHTDSFFPTKDTSKKKLDKMSKSEKRIMKPKPGEVFVEFEKCPDDSNSGLQLEVRGNFVFVKNVQSPAPAKHLHARDRVIALNGKKIEDYEKDMSLITATLESGNPIRLVINPTSLR